MKTVTRQAEYNRLIDAAHARALRLRREAIQAFWDGVGAAAIRALRALRPATAGKPRHYGLEA